MKRQDKKIVSALAATAITLTLLAGCSSSESDTASSTTVAETQNTTSTELSAEDFAREQEFNYLSNYCTSQSCEPVVLPTYGVVLVDADQKSAYAICEGGTNDEQQITQELATAGYPAPEGFTSWGTICLQPDQ